MRWRAETGAAAEGGAPRWASRTWHADCDYVLPSFLTSSVSRGGFLHSPMPALPPTACRTTDPLSPPPPHSPPLRLTPAPDSLPLRRTIRSHRTEGHTVTRVTSEVGFWPVRNRIEAFGLGRVPKAGQKVGRRQVSGWQDALGQGLSGIAPLPSPLAGTDPASYPLSICARPATASSSPPPSSSNPPPPPPSSPPAPSPLTPSSPRRPP